MGEMKLQKNTLRIQQIQLYVVRSIWTIGLV
jgi:hypothetical protein